MPGPENYDERNQQHISIDNFRESADFEVPARAQQRKPLRENYAAHAAGLIEQLAVALATQPGADPRLLIEGLKPGTIVEIATKLPTPRAKASKVPLALEFPTQEITVLRSGRNDDRTEKALLFVPDEARAFLSERIRAYGDDPGNRRRPDLERFEVIEVIRRTNANSLFIGDVDLAAPEVVWWELWVRQPVAMANRVADAARIAHIDVHEDRLVFPDTTVIFLHATAEAVATFASRVPGAIMEIRQARGTIETILGEVEGGIGQHDWVADLETRVVPPDADAAAVCILDTGIAAGHPLIGYGLRGAWAYDHTWGTDDHCIQRGGHGTPLAGLALYGDLEPLVNSMQPVQLTHAVESMKLLPPYGFPVTKPPSYGVVTQGAVSLVEANLPDARRSFCLASSTTEFPANRPSTWSGAIDQIASGSMPVEAAEGVPAANRPKRLVMIATGNMQGGTAEDVLASHPLEDPSQSWNALTIGGFTRKETVPVPPPAWKVAVPANHRSPFSLGSQQLPSDLTPIKPEVLFEAGNLLAGPDQEYDPHASVSLLALGKEVTTEPLTWFWATSAAVGVAGHFAGRLSAALPGLWPETYRALTVDSARWPEPIRSRLVGNGAHWKTGRHHTSAKRQAFLREVGYGVPDIDRAIMSARNDVTLCAQAEIQPYAIGADGKSGVFNEVHFYDLPWPTDALQALENEIVTIKVTLSYFIEPNLAGRAATRPDTYRSFGLRFKMKKRGETTAKFRSRVSASQDGDDTETGSEPSHWLLGPNAMQAGSLHCDLWRGHAVDLASHDAIAIYPVGGWWKSHVGQKRMKDKARYALTISICAEGRQVDLYSEIATQVEASVVVVGPLSAV